MTDLTPFVERLAEAMAERDREINRTYSAEFRAANRDVVLVEKRLYRQNNRPVIRQRNRQYKTQVGREVLREKQRDYYRDHPDYRAARLEYLKNYQVSHREQIAARKKAKRDAMTPAEKLAYSQELHRRYYTPRESGVPRGEAHPHAKMDAVKVREARSLRDSGVSTADIAQRFGVTAPCIHSILIGNTWKHVL